MTSEGVEEARGFWGCVRVFGRLFDFAIFGFECLRDTHRIFGGLEVSSYVA
jgi:hypothetical protein